MRNDLGKWPRLLVVGQPVTEEQANEILVRTNEWDMLTNDRAWYRAVHDALGIPIEDSAYSDRVNWDALRAFEQQVRALNLSYLSNHRVMSSWLGGPHGWCTWDGAIGTTEYNLGKWPDSAEVEADWRLIAEAFPYLDLTSQLVKDEGEADAPAVEYRVKDGAVTVDESPAKFITSAQFDVDRAVMNLMTGFRWRERGVDLQRLVEAVKQVTG